MFHDIQYFFVGHKLCHCRSKNSIHEKARKELKAVEETVVCDHRLSG